ncbi:MAG: hypothetical protein HRT36_04175 [Alphaproteobacteria bacterium]|nr:hypothetical protein [Alphaproteobacteria bacterium]
MPSRIARGNASRSRIRSRHAFAEQKQRMVLSIRAIGPARARAKITLANIASNTKRLVFFKRRALTG